MYNMMIKITKTILHMLKHLNHIIMCQNSSIIVLIHVLTWIILVLNGIHLQQLCNTSLNIPDTLGKYCTSSIRWYRCNTHLRMSTHHYITHGYREARQDITKKPNEQEVQYSISGSIFPTKYLEYLLGSPKFGALYIVFVKSTVTKTVNTQTMVY